MGDLLSKPSESNPSSAIATSAMSSPDSPRTHQLKSETEPVQQSKNAKAEIPDPESSDPPADTNPEEIQSETEPAQQSNNPEPETPVPESSDPPAGTNPEEIEDNAVEGNGDGEGADEEEEGEGECGFCLFMKGGGCKDTFVEWEKCVEEGEKNGEDIVEKCFQATAALRKCMDAHSEYYAPLLEAEKAAQEEAEKQLEEGKEEVSDGSEKKEES
ncbi:uncharacterized protein LOC142523278 [Primulina tabacum]|uniref:uncharacterized protein LOC142523278 n=1 Tax=Primulina tabacum TaxID=48773 RepID=UPI003F591C8C